MKKQIFLITIASLADRIVSLAGELCRSVPSDGLISGAMRAEASSFRKYYVCSVEEPENLMPELHAGDFVLIADGAYKDIKLVVTASGFEDRPMAISVEHPRQVKFCGDAKVEPRGDHVSFSGVLFADGERNQKE